jgi:hypothetical protein
LDLFLFACCDRRITLSEIVLSARGRRWKSTASHILLILRDAAKTPLLQDEILDLTVAIPLCGKMQSDSMTAALVGCLPVPTPSGMIAATETEAAAKTALAGRL